VLDRCPRPGRVPVRSEPGSGGADGREHHRDQRDGS
jgi:hypothetical protein